MTEEARRPDIPTIVGTVMMKAPGMVVRLGLVYLRYKRDSRKAAKGFVRNLERQGMPPELARRLGESYERDLDVRKMISRGGSSFLGMFRS